MKFIEFRKLFFDALNKKTGWGKEEIKRLFDEVYIEISGHEIFIETNKLINENEVK